MNHQDKLPTYPMAALQEGEIRVCGNHPDYRVPLIWTFKFDHKEFWCPYCGYTAGMFGAGEIIVTNADINARGKKYAEAVHDFLSSDDVKWELNRKAEEL
jgi:hypothetical protein